MSVEASDVPAHESGAAHGISTRMSALYVQHFGRAPEAVATYFPSPDVVLVVLESSMTVAEQRMADDGHLTALREARLATQQASADEFRGIVESVTGRRVKAFTSAHDVEADVATEAFVLHPDAA